MVFTQMLSIPVSTVEIVPSTAQKWCLNPKTELMEICPDPSVGASSESRKIKTPVAAKEIGGFDPTKCVENDPDPAFGCREEN